MFRILAGLLSITGIGALLLLNGKPFLNATIFTSCMLSSFALLEFSFHGSKNRPWSWHFCWLGFVIGVAMLYPTYQEQRRFQEKKDLLHMNDGKIAGKK